MADTTEPANPSSEPPNPVGELNDAPAGETSHVDLEADFQSLDTSLPPIDKSLPAMDTTIPSMDSSLPPMDSTIPSLPPIDTSLPPLDTTIPHADSHLDDLSGDPNFSFDTKDDELPGAEGTESHAVSGLAADPTDFDITDTSYQSHSNGTYPQHHPEHQQQQPHQQPPTPHNQTPQPQPQYQQQHAPSQQYSSPTPQPPGQQQGQPQHYQQHNPEMYHASPSASTPMSTPGMQTMEGQASHIPQAPIGSPMPPMASVGQYMTGYPTSVGQMGMNQSAQMRYQLPGDPNKMLSGGRHKKEVKRRTKTGCLTCRKRRIKCDEGHPVCRNCVKSKRECLGYDPVFKPQPTPSAIQPAPNPHPSLVVNPQDPSTSSSPSYPAAPPGYVPAVSQPFAPSESPSTSTERYDYGAAIDPSLDGSNNGNGNNHNHTTTINNHHHHHNNTSNDSANMASLHNATDGGLQPTVNPATTTTASDPTSFRVKQVQVSDLLALRGIPPPPPHPITSLPQSRLDEIQAVFLATYAPAIDKFFETQWFQEKALNHLLGNAQLMAEYSALIDAFNDRNLNDPNVIARLESFEASVVWGTMTTCRHAMSVSNGSIGQDYDLLAASKRLDVIEAMITGEHLDSNPLAQFPPRETPANPPSLADQLAQRSIDFWSAIGYFLTLHDNEASSAKEIDDTLARCRTLLDTFENRDVIYSIAIARHLGQRWADFPRSFPQPITTNEKDSGAKLYVAQKFLEQEAGGKGTTQVIKRICGMVLRSWIVSRE
ncbi:hypothetical protein N8T08_006642 [Aspergillus melleus]|uniref:Uncharacterized protein n=1 Tax=Aspergillus melleus TaxID=138277 RepID=A0ACC3BF72_9EURO|nr:hypothetical protein N8T08_006642 [Aspergillus melleus]